MNTQDDPLGMMAGLRAIQNSKPMQLINQPPTPYVGMPATYRIGSDAYAGRLIAVSRTGHQVTWQRYEEATKTANVGMAHVCSRRRNGEYLVVGSKYGSLKLGVAKTDLDQGF